MSSASEAWDQFCCYYSPGELHNGNTLKISFQLDNRLVNKRGSGGQCFHTLLRLHIVETWVASVSTPPLASPPPPQIKFNLHQWDSYSVAPNHIEVPLNEKTYNGVGSNYIIVFFSFESLLCFSDGESFLRQMFVCLPVCQSVLAILWWEQRNSHGGVGESCCWRLPRCSH